MIKGSKIDVLNAYIRMLKSILNWLNLQDRIDFISSLELILLIEKRVIENEENN